MALATGKELIRLTGRLDRLSHQVAFTPDSKRLLFEDEDSKLCFWDIARSKVVRRLEGATGFALSADGKTLAVMRGSDLLLHDAVSGKAGRRLGAALGEVRGFSADGRRLLVGRKLWDAVAGQEFPDTSEGQEAITSAALSPAGKLLATSHGDMSHRFGAAPVEFAPSVRIWDATTGKERRRFQGNQKCITEVVFSPDGKTLAVASEEASVQTVGRDHRQGNGPVRGHHFPVQHLNFSRRQAAGRGRRRGPYPYLGRAPRPGTAVPGAGGGLHYRPCLFAGRQGDRRGRQ